MFSHSQYFKSRQALMEHYDKHHYVCHHPDCADQEFSVFNSKIELMEHKRAVHHQKQTLAVPPFPLSHAQLGDLFGTAELAPVETPHVSERAIEAAKVFLVEDPSGWSREELQKRGRELDRELQAVFRGNPGKLERYQKHTGEFLRGTVSAATFYDVSLNVEAASRGYG